ncbi:uncharacterized protein MONOS_6961 [Monocercomonoides exilis]|uniref:uncharacterized protein n=1 Tax=Monocercomonoides exilis TaxID=2049356 RepID=UPI003559D4D7|nr:hypothetical protein MONOS_6961 [Monocercomonoides exilis]|eukprot:MONOS_6961.1-p1 / transcript=MONOS_6961.1 / gene=MONOS_6961 / organism=Monocercomonoides_exilis_PA203 / gene_product=unspecified product / transcript_product=unspecified product / location=Mono_scaffold00229:13134-13808(-) / protein_length=225 / sequence_SO=supercontig / SO=protein_coding / is_pseudo=false
MLTKSSFVPMKSMNFGRRVVDVVGNGTNNTIIFSSSIPPSSVSSTLSVIFSISSGTVCISCANIAHNSLNTPTPVLFEVTQKIGSLALMTIVIGRDLIGFSPISSPLFVVTEGSIKIKETNISSFVLDNVNIFQLFSMKDALELNSSYIIDISFMNGGKSCVLSSSTSSGASLVITNCTMTNIASAQQNQQIATNGGCVSFASSTPENTFSVNSTKCSRCCVNE